MLGINKMLLIFLLSLVQCILTFDYLFDIKSNTKVYKSVITDNSRVTVVVENSAEYLNVSLGNKLLKQIPLYDAKEKDKIGYSVKLHKQPFNYYLTENIPKLVQLSTVCEFTYPISIHGKFNQYVCAVHYINKHNNKELIGQCNLQLNTKSTYCFISANINQQSLTNDDILKSPTFEVVATVYYCKKELCPSYSEKYGWKILISVRDEWRIVGDEHIIWYSQYENAKLGLKFFTGLPLGLIDHQRILEIPIQLQYNNILIDNWSFQFLSNKYLNIHSVTSCSHSYYADFRKDTSTEKANNWNKAFVSVESIKSTDFQMFQCYNKSTSLILNLKIAEDIDVRFVEFEIRDLFVYFNRKKNTTIKKVAKSKLVIYLENGKIFPLVQKPVILPNSIVADELPYTLRSNSLKILYKFDKVSASEANFKCKAFNKNYINCPIGTELNKFSSDLTTNVTDHRLYDWFVEIILNEKVSFLIDMQPNVMSYGDWMLDVGTTNDYELNKINNWLAPNIGQLKTIHRNINCIPLYQNAPIILQKRLKYRDASTKKWNEISIENNEPLNSSDIEIINSTSVIYKSNKNLYVQNTQKSKFKLKLKNAKSHIQNSDFLVSEKSVSIRNLILKCISQLQLVKVKKILSSDIYFIFNVELKINFKNKFRNCFLVILIEFTDDSVIDLFSFPLEQFQLRLVKKSGKIKEVSKLTEMWLDDDEIVQLKLMKSRYCENPSVIYEKNLAKHNKRNSSIKSTKGVILQTDKFDANKFQNNQTSTSSLINSTSTTIPKSIEIDYVISHKRLIIITTTLILFVILIVLINLIILCFKRKWLCLSSRKMNKGYKLSDGRKNYNNNNNNDMQDKQHMIMMNQAEYPPLLPAPGPITSTDPANIDSILVTSPNTFWGVHNRLQHNPGSNFIRQSSVPLPNVKMTGYRYSQNISKNNPYTDPLWLDDHSSGFGTLNTTSHLEDTLLDPYDCKERYNKLSKLPNN